MAKKKKKKVEEEPLMVCPDCDASVSPDFNGGYECIDPTCGWKGSEDELVEYDP